jgi:hypothetical protein
MIDMEIHEALNAVLDGFLKYGSAEAVVFNLP